jgi:hypothetical protein
MTMTLCLPGRTAKLRENLDRDQQMRYAAEAALQASGYPAIAELECRTIDGAIVLSGTVSSYYLKQIAQAVVLRLGVVARVENRLEVRDA